ncbi:uncharacterized protein LOC133287503 [Gastrolobium bilobum]|uniref:uncharacterized protein LOC133287503 n=1 Tax=Gastrolobium bilobum TaxID=150636 RepID=UPI002AB26CCE|nr:uncharacterized protein LOC133287503 [Gastrolobium bilobum]
MASRRGCPHSQSHSHLQRHCPHCPLYHHCPHCPLHNPHFHSKSFQQLHYFTPLPQNSHLFNPLPLRNHPNSGPVEYNNQSMTSDAIISQELEHVELDGEEEDDEPVFVLTDEWREFFAKSEARRKLEKKQGKKGKK